MAKGSWGETRREGASQSPTPKPVEALRLFKIAQGALGAVPVSNASRAPPRLTGRQHLTAARKMEAVTDRPTRSGRERGSLLGAAYSVRE